MLTNYTTPPWQSHNSVVALWLADRESNPDKQNQNLLSYH
jgi:hypothetical protein